MNDTEYTRGFDRIVPAAELLERTKQTMHEKNRPARPAGRRWLERTALACAILCALSVGALAAVVAERRIDPDQVRLTQRRSAANAVPVGASDSSLGWTITVDEVYGDRWYAGLNCTLSRDDGKALTQGEYGFRDWDFGLDELNWSGGILWFADDNVLDNQIQFGFTIANDHGWDLAGRTLHLEIQGLNSANYDESLGLFLRGGGAWSLDVPLNYAPAEMTEYAPKLSLSIDGRQGTLDTLYYSPTTIWGEGSSGEGAFNALNGTLEGYDPADSTAWLILTDGTRIKGGAAGGSGDGSRITVEFYLDEHGPITPGEVCGIVIAQEEYPLALEEQR